MHVIDLEGNEYALQATSTNDNETNGNQSLSATILPTRANKLFIDDITEMWRVIDHDDVEHVIIYCKRKGEGDRLRVEIKAIPLFFDTLDNDRIYERHDEHMTANSAFTKIFDGTGFGFVLSDSFSAVQWEGFGDGETKLETFKRALERYKAEFRIVGNTVYLESQIGRDTSIMYRHRLNASNIVQEIDAKEMWTYAKGYGDYDSGEDGGWENAGLEREYTSPLADILGIRHAPPIKNGNITDKSTMDSQLKTLVDESLKVSVSADIHDLRNQGYPIAQSEVGDRVFLIDERIGLNDEVRVISQSITRNWRGDVIDLNITFGSEGIAKRHQSNISTAVKDIKDLLDGKKVLPYSVLDEAVKNATKTLRDEQTELAFSDNGILAVDKNDPNLVTLFNSAGLGVSNDGGNTFENAITGEGINASVITAGVLHGINIIQESSIGRIEMSDGDFRTYYEDNLALEISDYRMRFYNRDSTQIGAIYPVTSLVSGDKGMALEVSDDSYLSIGPNIDGTVYPSFTVSPHDNRTYVAGPYNGAHPGSRLELYANRRHLSYANDFSAYDQPAIIMDQGEDTNNMYQYFGGTNRRSDSVWQVRHNYESENWRSILTAESDGVTARYSLKVPSASGLNQGVHIGSGNTHVITKNTSSDYLVIYPQRITDEDILRVRSHHQFDDLRNDLRIRYNGDIEGKKFVDSSMAEYKVDIKEWDVSAIDILSSSKVYEWTREESDKKEYGFVIGDGYETPLEVVSESGEGVSGYAHRSLNTKAIQELISRVEKLEEING